MAGSQRDPPSVSHSLCVLPLSGMLLETGFEVERLAGMLYSPLSGQWSLSSDTAVNYILSARRLPRKSERAAVSAGGAVAEGGIIVI